MNKALVRAALVTSTLAAVLLPVRPASAATMAVLGLYVLGRLLEVVVVRELFHGSHPAHDPVNQQVNRNGC